MCRRVQIIAVAIVCVLASCSAPSANTPAPDANTLAPGYADFEGPDLVNPLRGQYENLLSPLFPQASTANQQFPPWPGTDDVNVRIDWRLLQPRDPRTLPPNGPDNEKFDFTALDEAVATAAQQGRRFGFRITSFNSCCETSYPHNTDISVPDWLQSVSGATQNYVHDGITYVIPDWNNEAYLSYFAELLAALGRRYDRDERIALFEMSGYGDFSENHVAFMSNTLGIPAPSPSDSEAQLGYFSQYSDQFITKQSIEYLVAANLAAFPNTQIITAMLNPEIVKQMFRDSPLLRNRKKPVGIRADGLGVYAPIPDWAAQRDSYYVRNNDPINQVVADRYKVAPIVTEWIPQIPSDTSTTDYYLTGLRDVVNYHVSMTASTGFPAQSSNKPMSPDDFTIWSRANKFSGYRYAVIATGTPIQATAGKPVRIPLRWTNFGSAPTYENWQPEFEVQSDTGAVVRTVTDPVDLHTLVADQRFEDDNSVPAAHTVDSNLVIGDLPRGNYSVRVRVAWHEHKPDATHTMDYPPMQLAQPGRAADGTYPITTIRVT